jgi:hypothetical protein
MAFRDLWHRYKQRLETSRGSPRAVEGRPLLIYRMLFRKWVEKWAARLTRVAVSRRGPQSSGFAPGWFTPTPPG